MSDTQINAGKFIEKLSSELEKALTRALMAETLADQVKQERDELLRSITELQEAELAEVEEEQPKGKTQRSSRSSESPA